MKKYSAKLLFQFRVSISGQSSKRRICEERIVLFQGRTASSALKKAIHYGRREEHDFLNDDGNSVYVEFVGVLELIHLGIECRENEVLYEITERLQPMERKGKLIPAEESLSAVRIERQAKQRMEVRRDRLNSDKKD